MSKGKDTAFAAMLAALKAAVALSDKRVTSLGRTAECQRVYDQCAAAISKAEVQS